MKTGQFLGALLMAIGTLIMFLSGGCTLVVVVLGAVPVGMTLIEGRFGDVLGAMLMPLICGGMPFLIGMGINNLGKAVSGDPKLTDGTKRPDDDMVK